MQLCLCLLSFIFDNLYTTTLVSQLYTQQFLAGYIDIYYLILIFETGGDFAFLLTTPFFLNAILSLFNV